MARHARQSLFNGTRNRRMYKLDFLENGASIEKILYASFFTRIESPHVRKYQPVYAVYSKTDN